MVNKICQYKLTFGELNLIKQNFWQIRKKKEQQSTKISIKFNQAYCF